MSPTFISIWSLLRAVLSFDSCWRSSSRFILSWSACLSVATRAASRLSTRRGVPASTTSPGRCRTATMREAMGELMTSSNAGATRPDAFTVTSMSPRPVVENLMSDSRTVLVDTELTNHSKAPNPSTTGTAILAMATARVRICCFFDISLSILRVIILMPYIIPKVVPKR